MATPTDLPRNSLATASPTVQFALGPSELAAIHTGHAPEVNKSENVAVPLASQLAGTDGRPPQSAAAAPSTGVKQTAAPLIDFNCHHPDGTTGALHSVLVKLAELLKMEVYAGILADSNWLVASSLPQNHREQQLSKLFLTAITEAACNTTGYFSAQPDQQTSMVLQTLRVETSAACVFSFGLPCNNGSAAMLLVSRTSEETAAPTALAEQIKQLRTGLIPWIELFVLCNLGARASAWHVRWRKFAKRRKTWFMLCGGLLAAMALPVPYWPQRECIVEPASRRFLSSPVNGRVMDAQVRPGDLVAENQLLATIDGEAVRWELATAEAEYQKACKKSDAALASRSSGDLRMAQFECEQFAIQIDSLKSKLEQLEIRSPIAGVVVDGDWVRTAGSMVERSQTMFEIAPLNSMRVRTLLSTEDLGQINRDTAVTIRVDSAQGQSWTGTLERIDPRGRVEGSAIVFEAETVVDNSEQILRPGMRGSARLSAGWHSLGWMIFNRPYVWFMKKLAW